MLYHNIMQITSRSSGQASLATQTSSLFRHIETLHGDAAWGGFLDAGTGVNSALWSLSLPTDRWVGVTGASAPVVSVVIAWGTAEVNG